MNKVILVGNVCRDIERRETKDGTPVVNFGLAVHRSYKNAQGQYDADFIDCVAFRSTADFISKYFAKGSKIGLVGRLQTRSYDAQDGSKRKVTEVLVDEVEFVAPKAAPAPAPAPAPDEFAEAEDEGVPF